MHSSKSIPLAARISVGVGDAATMTGLSRSRIYELIGKNEIRTTHVGRRHLVLVSSLRELVGDTPHVEINTE